MIPLRILRVLHDGRLVDLIPVFQDTVRIRLANHVGLDQVLGLDQIHMKDRTITTAKVARLLS